MKKVKKISKVCLLLVCIISLVCIPFATSASAASYEPSKAAKINYFGANQTTISSGGTAKLSWNVSNASKIEIKGIENEKYKEETLNPQQGEIEVWPEMTTTYVLTAYGDGGNASATVTVNVGTVSKAKVDYFAASATSVQKGNSVKLTWKTSNAKGVDLKGFEDQKLKEDLDLNGELEVWPEVTTTYVLIAYGANGDADSKTITVNVVEQQQDVTINYFNASNSEITVGQNTNLNWGVSNAKSVAIKNVKSGLAAQGSYNVAPTYTTTYTLEAVGYNGKTVTKDVTVTVKQGQNNPAINYFNATSMTISKGDMVTLSWGTSNATGCMILTSDGSKLTNRPTSGKITVTPNSTRTYTLVAYNANKEQVQKTITITVK